MIMIMVFFLLHQQEEVQSSPPLERILQQYQQEEVQSSPPLERILQHNMETHQEIPKEIIKSFNLTNIIVSDKYQ